MKYMLRITFLITLILVATSIVFNTVNSRKTLQENKGTVVTSFYPIYFFASQIAGDKFRVLNLTPPGLEPHEYELSTRDIIEIENSHALLINGGGFEPWAAKIPHSLENKDVKIVSTGDGLFSINGDPHIWLSPLIAQRQAENILNTFIEIDSENAEYYKKNFESLKTRFLTLDMSMRKIFSDCESRTIVTSHDAFGYLASDYGLTQLPISGLSPEEEPSPKKMAEVVDFAKRNKVEYIFFETLVSPRLAETIAKEIGAETLVFNPIEGLSDSELKEGKDYFSIQESNLASIKIALKCEK